MKRAVIIISAVVLSLCLCLAIIALAAKTPPSARLRDAESENLKFDADGTFKIIQVADLQEFFLSSALSMEFIRDLAEKEKPDLFVLTGDNIASGAAKIFPKFISRWLVKISVNSFMKRFDKIYKDFGIPVTMVYGNHDNEASEKKVSRAEQFAMYAAHPSFAGYYIPEADEGTEDKDGQHYGTHNIVVKDSAGTVPVFNIWMFDSGSYDLTDGYSGVQAEQVAWFRKTNAALGVPSIAFQHIVVPEVFDVLTPAEEANENTIRQDFMENDEKVGKWFSKTLPAGIVGEVREAPCPGMFNEGQFAALNAGGVKALFFGHDHVNSFELVLDGTDLINTPSAAFGSYGDIDIRGARIITISQADDYDYTSKHVTLEDYCSGSKLQQSRLKMYHKLYTFAAVLDFFSFRPLLWIAGLFD